MLKQSVLPFSILLVAASLSCHNNSVGPSDENQGGFSLTISVVNAGGNPVGGLVISEWNELSGFPVRSNSGGKARLQKTTAVSSITFDVASPAHIDLSAYECDNQLVAPLAVIENAVVGMHVAHLALQLNAGTRVLKCRLVATTTSTGALLFEDSIYAVLWQYDYTLSRIGVTSATGKFQTRDSLLFPNVLSLPPLVETDATGPTLLGTFTISDSVAIVLDDTLTHQSQIFYRTVGKASNDLHLTWDPQPGSLPPLRPAGGTMLKTEGFTFTTSVRSQGWKLYQNYPNPFN
jgi:hypothetical protein